MATPTRIALSGDPERLAACAPQAGAADLSATLVPSGQPLPPDAELVIAIGAAAYATAAPPIVVWLDPGESPPDSLRACDRVVAADSGVEGAWRTLPSPVADALFAGSPLLPPEPRACWLGPSGPRREEYARRHAAAAVEVAAWENDRPPAPFVAVNLPEGGHTGVTHELAAALAAGCLLVSETLSPALGLEPGVDYLEARDPDDLFIATENALRRPQAFRRIQLAGRRKAEWLRASTVLARIARDLRLELAAT